MASDLVGALNGDILALSLYQIGAVKCFKPSTTYHTFEGVNMQMSLNHFLGSGVLNVIGDLCCKHIGNAASPNSDIWSSSHQLMRVVGGDWSNDLFESGVLRAVDF